MAGRARQVFEQYAEAAGLDPAPRGALAEYVADLLGRVPQLRALCDEADEERLHALRECEAAAAGLLAYFEREQARPSRATRRPARAAKTPPAPAAQVPAATRLADRAAARRAAMRSRR